MWGEVGPKYSDQAGPSWLGLLPTCVSEVPATVLELRRTVQVEPAELLLEVVLGGLVGGQEGWLGVVRGHWGGAGRVVGAVGAVGVLNHSRTSHPAGLLVLLLLLLLWTHRLLLQSLQLLLSLPEQSLQQLGGGLHVLPGRAVLGAALLTRTLLVGRGRLCELLVESGVRAGPAPARLRGRGEVGGDQGGGVVVPLTVRRAALPPSLSRPISDGSTSASSTSSCSSSTSCSSSQGPLRSPQLASFNVLSEHGLV